MKSLFISIIFAAAVAFNTSTIAASWTFSSDGQTITGIEGISVFDIASTSYSLYDVKFHNKWNGTFHEQSFSFWATEALLELFKDGGQFSGTYQDLSHDTKIVGFEALTTDIFFNMFVTPYNYNLTTSSMLSRTVQNNFSGIFEPYDIHNGMGPLQGPIYNDGDFENVTYLEWSAVSSSISSVSVPAAIWLFLPALFGIIGLRKRAKSA